MSKIQEALARIRVTRNAEGENRARENDKLVVARVAQRADSESAAPSARGPGLILEINQISLQNAGLLAPDYHEELLANQYREIKRPLIAHAFGLKATQIESGNLIMVTSALANEGKSFTSINLALSMSRERDYSVVLVDGDVVNPNISNIFGVSAQPGLLDILDDTSIAVDDIVIPTDVTGLSILPAGKSRRNATELLASRRMDTLMHSIRTSEPGRLVIMDSPPLLQTSEAKILAGMAGQIVLVVRAEVTAQGAVLNALELLGDDKAVNLVLNQVRDASLENVYGYGYGYGYGSTAREEDDGKVTRLAKEIWE